MKISCVDDDDNDNDDDNDDGFDHHHVCRCLVSHLRGKKLKILCVDDNDDDDNNYDDNADNDDQHIFVQVPGIPFGITAQTIYLATGLIIAAYHVRK